MRYDRGDDLPDQAQRPPEACGGTSGGTRGAPPEPAPDGAAAHAANLDRAQSARGVRLPRLRLARPGGPPARRRVLRERRQGGGRGGDDASCRRRRCSRATRSPSWRAVRLLGIGKLGRLTEPMHLAPGGDHYRPISWDDAYELIAAHLAALDSPDEAIFYTSGRTSNEAAFLYQALVRALGTNNLPDCSNMCHESSGTALGRDDRDRQGQRHARGHPPGRPARHRRPESGHQPPADAERARDRQEARRQDRRDQPAARGRADALQQPADPARRCSGSAGIWPTCTCRSASTATSRSSRPSTAG